MDNFYRGIPSFVMIQVIALATLIFFPQIITYLPDLFFGR
jgi:TRAP-type mannitol/chloroaromatic compound transport system permease large subunit